MSRNETMLAKIRDERFASLVAVINDVEGSGVGVRSVEATRWLFRAAVLLRKAEIARRKRNLFARERNQAFRDLGLVRVAGGWE